MDSPTEQGSHSDPSFPSIRRQLWMARRRQRKRTQLALLCVLFIFFALMFMASMGWLTRRSKDPQPTGWNPGGYAIERSAPGSPPADERSAAKRQDVAGAVEWQEGAGSDELVFLVVSFAGTIVDAQYRKALKNRQLVYEEASWVAPMSVQEANLRLQEVTSNPQSGLQSTLTPVDAQSTKITLRRIF
jgi:hypothetical protein